MEKSRDKPITEQSQRTVPVCPSRVPVIEVVQLYDLEWPVPGPSLSQ